MKLSARRTGAGLRTTVKAREPPFFGVLGEEGPEQKNKNFAKEPKQGHTGWWKDRRRKSAGFRSKGNAVSRNSARYVVEVQNPPPHGGVPSELLAERGYWNLVDGFLIVWTTGPPFRNDRALGNDTRHNAHSNRGRFSQLQTAKVCNKYFRRDACRVNKHSWFGKQQSSNQATARAVEHADLAKKMVTYEISSSPKRFCMSLSITTPIPTVVT